jgi:hypothetical protein
MVEEEVNKSFPVVFLSSGFYIRLEGGWGHPVCPVRNFKMSKSMLAFVSKKLLASMQISLWLNDDAPL